jgi:DNA-binding winged helix-turn-helix (wHTH) protein
MKYKFLNFTLDTDKKELYANKKAIELQKGYYDLLLFLLNNPGKMFTKSEIIEQVWQGRHVTENSIDQVISKIRKILNSYNKDIYIKTVYGKGLMFVPEVTISDTASEDTQIKPSSKVSSYKNIFGLLALASVVLLTMFLTKNNQIEVVKPDTSLLLIMSADINKEDKDKVWLSQASGTFIEQMFGIANIAQLKKIKNKPEHLNRQQYINNQWKISPELKVVTSHLAFENNIYKVELNITDRLQHQSSQSFSHQNLSTAMTMASQWSWERLTAL